MILPLFHLERNKLAKKKASNKPSSGDRTGIYANCKTAFELMEEQRDSNVCISIGPKLDYWTGGGIPSGTVVLIRTKEKCGKTALCMNIVRNALLQGRRVFFFDVELRLLGAKYFKMQGFDPKNPNFFYIASTDVKSPMSAEDCLMQQIQLMQLEENRGAVYVIDSLSKLVEKDVLNSDNVSGQRRSGIAKVQTDWMAKAGNLIRMTDSVVIGVQHLMMEQNSANFKPQLKAKGASGFGYEADITFESKSNPADLDGKTQFSEADLSGITLKLRIPHNKRRAPLNTADGTTTYIKFGEGVYFAKEALELLQTLYREVEHEDPNKRLIPRVNLGGAWYTFDCDEFQAKVQGTDNAIQLIEENKEFFQNFIRKYMVETFDARYEFTK